MRTFETTSVHGGKPFFLDSLDAQQDWITFRPSKYVLDELTKDSGKFATINLYRTLDRYRAQICILAAETEFEKNNDIPSATLRPALAVDQ